MTIDYMTSETHCIDCKIGQKKKLTLKQRRKYQHRCDTCELRYNRRMLKRFCPKGSTVYTVLRHVSRSGTSRRIDVYSIRKNELVYLSGYIEGITDMKRHKDGGLLVHGCGMDMGFHIVHNLSMALYGFDNRGAYALDHSWI